MRSIISSAWRARGAIFSIHLVMSILAVAIIGPLVGFSVQLGVSLSGKGALTDFDIAKFLFSPLGLIVLIVLAAIILTAAALELAALLIALRDGGSVAGPLARRLPALLALTAQLVVRVLLLVLPFAAIIAIIVFSHIGAYDINYYLSKMPPEFVRAILYSAPLLLIAIGLLAWSLAGWVMALPLVLSGHAAGAAIKESTQLTRSNRRKVAMGLFIWAIVTLVISALIGALMRGAIVLLMPPVTAGLGTVAIMGLVSLLIWAGANLLTGAISAGLLAAAVDNLAARLIPEWERARPAYVPGARRRMALLVGAVAVFGAVTTGWNLMRGAAPRDDVAIIAHRGAAGARPENTIAAMKEALAQGADWLEIDVQEDATGRVVVAHDSDFMKLADNPLTVWDATPEALAQIDVGSWFDPAYADERVPTLRDVLELARGKAGVVVELKYYGHDEQLAARVAQIVEETGMVEATQFMSLKPKQVADMRATRPGWPVGLLAATSIGDLSDYDADFLAVSTGAASRSFIADAQDAGKKVYVWTVNDPLDMAQMLSRGVDGLITDEPGLARDVMAELANLTTGQRLMLELAALFGMDASDKTYRDESP
ncbi:MAG: glycerophosphodiester phosphodiesterase [Rhodobacterales bacterium]|nr:MAG: glycerophosphodiester phosphodiesterase [Rhodobacterales bacterium]PIE06504.1 MAG: glycerophosphodiester phosphodiesterase [Rhodobacterales bacterium]